MARKEETLIATINMVLTPAMFLSAVFMRLELMPHWIQTVARYNPVNWAVVVGSRGDAGERRLERGALARRLPGRVHGRLRGAGDAGVPRLPAVGVTRSGMQA